MASYCPHCGVPAPDEARFCMKCGRERLPEPKQPPAPPVAPPTVAPPPVAPAPAYAPAGPSPVGAFLGRTFRGGWAGSAQAALWPVALLLITAVSLAIPSYGQNEEAVVGFATRMRIALALLLQSVGGGVELSGREERPDLGGSDGLGLGSNGLGTGSDGLGTGSEGLGLGSDASGSALEGSAVLHSVPLTVTVLWILALFIGVRVLRNRLVARGAAQGGGTTGLEAAVRVALLVTVSTLALALFAQPEIEGIELSSSPALAALGALVLGLVVSCGVLSRNDLAHWVAARPGAQSALRATGAALRALVAVLALCSVVAFISLTQIDDLAERTDLDDSTISPLLLALLVLPNLAVTALGIGWGAAAEATVSGRSSLYGSGNESGSFGLSELGDVTNDWAVVGALALGLVCVLTLGVVAARRCAGRGEALLAAGVFFGLVLLLAGFSGIGVELSGQALDGGSGFGESGSGGTGSVEVGPAVAEVLLFGLLWIFPAVLAAPYLLQMVGQQGRGPAALGVGLGVGVGLTPASGPGPVPAYVPAYAPPGAPPVPPVPGMPAGPPTATPADTTPADAPASDAPTSDASTSEAPASDAPPSGPDAPAAPAVPLAEQPTSGAVGTPGTPPSGTTAPTPTPTPTPAPVYAPHTVHLGHQPPAAKSRGRAGIWVATLTVAFVVGGGATAGILFWQDGHDKADGAGKDDRPAVSRSEEPSEAPSGAPSPVASPSPSPEPGGSEGPDVAGGSEAPAGTERVTDQEGFSFAVPEGWTRQAVNPERPGQITYAGPTGREEFLVGVVTDAPYTSYENFKNIEKHTKSAPDKSDYDRVRLTENTFKGQDGAIWEYTYTDASGRSIHALNQSYIAENGTEYAIQLSWREDFWIAGEGARTHRTALDTWRLTD
ncbi:zinc ribbon domain-containing protein [Streptomyces sp. NPDC046465]|uniref:zinc ribbon domain-containing protein n=1 Tax=Streptomyces sp. NPDC046465 TaxID=3155810 RepID=UPI0033D03B18